MGLFKSIGKGLGKALGTVLKPVTWLLSALLPTPKVPRSVQTNGQMYNASAKVNESRIGDIKPRIDGRTKYYPCYVSEPYFEFVAHAQVMNVYLHVNVGKARILGINIGDTPIANFPGIESEVLAPGEDMTLIRPNVYSCPDCDGIELQAGAYEFDGSDVHDPTDGDGIVVIRKHNGDEVDDDVVFADNGDGTGTITVAQVGWFYEFVKGDILGLYDAEPNEEIDFELLDHLDDGATIRVSPAPTPGVNSDGIGVFVRKRWAGPFPACQPGATIQAGAIDLDFPQGLFDDEADGNRKEVRLHLQYQEIDDAGNIIGAWTDASVPVDGEIYNPNGTPTAAPFVLRDNIASPRRITVEFTIASSMRCQMRLWRETMQGNDGLDLSACQWVGLKGYIDTLPADSPASDPDCTRLALRIRGSGMLAQASLKAVNVIAQAQRRQWDGADWTAEVDNRNPVWDGVDWLLTESNGAITEARFDLPEIKALADFADSNSDTWDGVIDREVILWEGAQTYLRVMRSKFILDPLTQLITVYRDEPADPVQMFCDGFNCRAGEDSIRLPDADTPTGVTVRFTDPILYAQREGPTVGSSDDPLIVDIMGMTSWDKSWDEANFIYRDRIFRNHTVSVEAEMEGIIPRHGKRVLLASSVKGWGQCGKVIDWDSGTNTLHVQPAPIWTTGLDHYVYLQDEDGTPVGPFEVTQGIAPHYLVLSATSGLPTLRTGANWKTLYAFGHDGDEDADIEPDAPRVAIVMERDPNGLHENSLSLLFENDFVHADPGVAPADPYSLSGSIPDLTITGLTLEQDVEGDALLDPNVDPLTSPDGEFLIGPGGGEAVGVLVHASWNAVSGATLYQLRWRYVAGSWTTTYSGIANSATFAVPHNGTVQVRVKAYSTTWVGTETQASIVIDAYP